MANHHRHKAGAQRAGFAVKGVRSTPRQQRGYTVIAAMFALMLVAGALAILYRAQARNAHVKQAEISGQYAAQFAVGLRGFLATVQGEPGLMPSGAMTGVNWLKAPGCGGIGSNRAEGYVPCNYTGGTLGTRYQTTFTRNASTNAIEARTTFVVPPRGADPKSAVLMAERIAQAALSGQSLPLNGMFFTAFANVPATATGPGLASALPGADAGRVVMVANNAPSHDIWLRTDGTNMMMANLNMDGWNLANANDGRFLGTVQIDKGLIVGEDSIVDVRGEMLAKDIKLTDIDAFASEGIYNAVAMQGVGTVPKPDCAKAGGRPGIYVSMQSTGGINSAGYKGDALYSAGARVADSGSHWTVTPEATGVKFDLARSGTDITFTKSAVSSNPSDMRWVAMTRCR